MTDLNHLDNRPLARAALWFLIDAVVVLAVPWGVLLHPELVPEFFDHPTIHMAGIVILTALFAILATTSSVLGFLANCRPGRTIGWVSFSALVLGVAAVVSLILVQ